MSAAAMEHPHLALVLVIVRAPRKSEDLSPSEGMKDFSMEEEEGGQRTSTAVDSDAGHGEGDAT